MDKRIILAVAGSGKTTKIINNLNINNRTLIITYTRGNFENLRLGIIKRFKYFPKNFKLFTYFTFINSFCCLPYLKDEFNIKGVRFKANSNYYAKGKDRYITRNGLLYSNRIAKFIEVQNVIDDVKRRIIKYFDDFFIDEIQDFGGHDFTFLEHISTVKIPMMFVGDFYQHTYDTSRDGPINQNLHVDYESYKERFKKLSFDIDTSTLSCSYRCKPMVCSFVTNKLGIKIESHSNENVSIDFITDIKQVKELVNNNNIIKLFFKEHYKYIKYSRNWGDCKGDNRYLDVCVVLNKKSYNLYKKEKLQELPPLSKNRLYVAITRANRNVFFIEETKARNLIE